LAALAASLAGLVGLIYVLGAFALYSQLFAAGVPAGEALDEFTARRFVVIGVPMTILLAAVGGIVWWSASKVPRTGRLLVVPIAVIVTLAIGIIIANLAFPIALRMAVVQLKGEAATCLSGAYISTDAQGVHLADGVNHALRTVSSAEVAGVTLGSKKALGDQSIEPANCP
jgi:hypothetical protein